eukprot:TRINITY_DN5152_c0_g1_i1.p1 TRINITY_DN5152_c0_g1~~TRINITY_DN5152_c0_g1_i1.p1  ORF type:complete len:311 (+),score=33.29 TRINITY_DN5152_c0_g1_i1:76-933(+)
MAPARHRSQEMSVPTQSLGKLIGKGGATIKELQDRTSCSVHTPRRAEQDEQAVQACVTVRCTLNQEEVADAQIAKCVRAIQLLCSEGLGLAEVLEKVQEEERQQKEIEDQLAKQRYEDQDVRRMMMYWPEFSQEDVHGAWHASDNDEDLTFQLLSEGFRVAPKPVTQDRSIEHPPVASRVKAVVEEYPALLSSESSGRQHGFCLGAVNRWSKRSSQARRAVMDDFPALPLSSSIAAADHKSTSARRGHQEKMSCEQPSCRTGGRAIRQGRSGCKLGDFLNRTPQV